ncbi:MAG: hypothetical protein LBO77_07770 [Desulfovibrio sp.]|nr:hypothetical protein [Desulfovibrio sp.]
MIYALVLTIFLFKMNFHIDHSSFDKNVANIPLTDGKKAVLGPTNAWYSLRTRHFYASFEALKKGEGEIPEKIYYIKSIYTEQLPACAKIMQPAGSPFSFNLQEVQAFEVDLTNCRTPRAARASSP